MLKTAITEAAVDNILDGAEKQLLFLFDRLKIPRDVQAKVVDMGCADREVFASIEDTAEKVRKIFREDIDLDDTKGGPFLGVVAKLVSAWQSANKEKDMAAIDEIPDVTSTFHPVRTGMAVMVAGVATGTVLYVVSVVVAGLA